MASVATRANRERKKHTILVVEDEVLVRLDVADALRDRGHTVIEAANADEALTILGSNVVVDLVFTDIQMPGSIDGMGLLTRLRQTHPHLPLVVASGKSPSWPSATFIDAFFGKPYDVARVTRRVEELLKESGE